MLRVSALYFVLFVQFLDASIVSIGLPAMGRDLRVEAVLTQWIVTAYLLGIVVALPLSLRITRTISPRFVLAWSMAVFLVASCACAGATTLPGLAGARFTQGLASGSAVLVGQRLLIEFLGEERKAYALTLWTSAVSIAPVVGPVAGALLVDLANWRWMFIINVPLTLICFLVLRKDLLWRTRAVDIRAGLGQLLLLASIAVVAQFLTAQVMTTSEQRLLNLSNELLAAALILAVGAFVAVGHVTGDWVFNWRLLKHADFAICTLAIVLVNGLLLIAAIVIPFWFQNVRQFPLLLIGYVLGVTGLVSSIVSPVVGRRLPRKAFPIVACLSMFMMGASFVMSGAWQLNSPLADVVWPRIVLGGALGLFAVVGPLSIARFSGSDLNEANALSLFARILFTNLGIGLLLGGYDRLTHYLGAYAVSTAWVAATPRGEALVQVKDALDATVSLYAIKIGSYLISLAFFSMLALLVLLFLGSAWRERRRSTPQSEQA